jgi:hypothetical protein
MIIEQPVDFCKHGLKYDKSNSAYISYLQDTVFVIVFDFCELNIYKASGELDKHRLESGNPAVI